ncbi:HET-domain-containing protein, partial [Parathielavia appendiculata]
HANCSPHHETILPSRLVDVGSSNADGCRLYLPSENETGLYIALSHCWGGVTPTQTTQGNFESFTQQIPEPLPQTFSDAVAVTRAFGIRYLWIDSLCIIQDSPEDWALHAPLMAKVYGDAWVTISADAAADSFEGFLQHADRGRFRAVRSRRGSAACSELAKLLVTFCRSRNSVPDSRLSTRGWVFQERALAPRTLHFGSAEVGWECRSLINCECS